ncbi:MAG TPA: hypothetical protein VM285_04790, partial [Polyangia bacterium]|nr:hypothetical protein [Polyangia bacterium]
MLEQIEEEVRSTDAAAATGTFGADDRFWKSGLYAFRIKGPADDAFFPLVLNPTRYFKRLPFSVEVTPTQEGGIFVEKQGIVVGQLILEGHTGFAPRRNEGETGLPRPTVALSGQAHFLRLQNLCFGR